MTMTAADKRSTFRHLHEAGCFVMPNPWDAGSAILLESLGFKALASTSAGFAWSLGRPDYAVSLEEVLDHLTALAGAVDLPVNADFENAFAHAPEDVAANVARAVETGIAGLSVEDSRRDARAPLYDFSQAVERVSAARAAIDASGGDVLLTARCEGFFVGRPDLDETLGRLVAYSDAGADCLYAPGLRDESQIAALVKAVAPKPVNVLTLGLPVATLAALGVRRVSVGGSLACAALGEFLRAAEEIVGSGSFAAFERGAPGARLNGIFAERPGDRP
jgi:2-methylisocitrate lyase-like PEP mutase family enzyme